MLQPTCDSVSHSWMSGVQLRLWYVDERGQKCLNSGTQRDVSFAVVHMESTLYTERSANTSPLEYQGVLFLRAAEFDAGGYRISH